MTKSIYATNLMDDSFQYDVSVQVVESVANFMFSNNVAMVATSG
jgi:hypothetical protein